VRANLCDHYRVRHTARRWLRAGALATVLMAGLTACASAPQPTDQSDTMTIQGQPVSAVSTPVVAPPAEMPVQSGNLGLPSEQLGILTYDEPFSPRAIDQDHIDEKLRSMAINRWGNQVDAVVGVTTSLSPDRSEVTVEAEGIHVKSDCSFCRHGVTASAASP
jgi:hypothetical protein